MSPPVPDGPGSVSGAQNLPQGFTDTFTSRYVDVGEVRLHAVVGGDGPPRATFGFYRAWDATRTQNEQRQTRRLAMPVLAIGGAASWGEHVGDAMKLAADDVQSVVISAPATGSPRLLPNRCWRR